MEILKPTTARKFKNFFLTISAGNYLCFQTSYFAPWLVTNGEVALVQNTYINEIGGRWALMLCGNALEGGEVSLYLNTTVKN